ncbi:hypothetical protein AOQ84DRAFT_357468 [Glonium stellatum]|uniref:Uncharacterized protein n=1 Tax=Glonium stellatum TaxID=574774 RepID=A0A8E2JLY8_9PEZI|nr:hypothetical protein AOQ84DRAFT_357468 [Glonium stellatum]
MSIPNLASAIDPLSARPMLSPSETTSTIYSLGNRTHSAQQLEPRTPLVCFNSARQL